MMRAVNHLASEDYGSETPFCSYCSLINLEKDSRFLPPLLFVCSPRPATSCFQNFGSWPREQAVSVKMQPIRTACHDDIAPRHYCRVIDMAHRCAGSPYDILSVISHLEDHLCSRCRCEPSKSRLDSALHWAVLSYRPAMFHPATPGSLALLVALALKRYAVARKCHCTRLSALIIRLFASCRVAGIATNPV